MTAKSSAAPSTRRRCQLLTLAIAITAITLAACGGNSPKSTANNTPASSSTQSAASTGSSAKTPVRACDIVTLAQLSQTLGREVTLDPEGTNNGSQCDYVTTGRPRISFTISADPATHTVQELVAGNTPVDIGEGGYVFASGAQIGFLQHGVEYQINLQPFDPTTNETLAVARLVASKA
jgi:hypothetical protein